MRAPGRRDASGFTLLELLVAMGIFAVIGAMALGGLNAVVGQETQAREQTERLAMLQRALRLLSTDFSSVEPRFIRDDKLAEEAFHIMESLRIDELPVVDKTKRVVGLLDVQDLMRAGRV